MRRSIIGQVELRRSAAAEAAVSAAVRHRGVGRAAAERAPLPLALLAPPGRAGADQNDWLSRFAPFALRAAPCQGSPGACAGRNLRHFLQSADTAGGALIISNGTLSRPNLKAWHREVHRSGGLIKNPGIATCAVPDARLTT